MATDALRQEPTRRFSETALLWSSLIFSMMWGFGAYVDSRYHAHQGFEIESFLTPTHALLYGGVTGVVVVVGAYLFESWRLGDRRERWLPPGYKLVLGGAVAFMAVGVLDALWHEAFGFEADLEALLSPTHVVLVLSRMVANVGILWAALRYRQSSVGEGAFLRIPDVPATLTVALLFSGVTFLASYSEPWVIDYPAASPVAVDIHFVEGIEREAFTARIAATSGLLLHTSLLVLFLVVALRRLALPVGAITIIMLYSAAQEAFIADMWRYLPAVLLGALVGEVIWARLRSDANRSGGRRGYWLLGALVPFTQTAGYFAIMALGGGIVWTIHLWAGAPFIAALYGLVVAVVLVPPAFVERIEAARPLPPRAPLSDQDLQPDVERERYGAPR